MVVNTDSGQIVQRAQVDLEQNFVLPGQFCDCQRTRLSHDSFGYWGRMDFMDIDVKSLSTMHYRYTLRPLLPQHEANII